MPNTDDNSNNPEPADKTQESVNLQDLVVDLNFVPTWARKPNGESNPYQNQDFSGREERRDRGPRRDQRRNERTGARPPKSAGGSPGQDRPRGDQRDDGRRNQRDGGGGRPHSSGSRYPQREERVYLPVEISFIPDRDRLGAVVRQLHAVKRSFPLTYISGLFLTKPEHHMLKLESRTKAGSEPIQFFQCRKTKVVFLSREALTEYLVRTHLDQHFERVEQTIEPPTGNFVCVGQCKRSGLLLGPPNYHGYNERLLEVHRSKFPQISLDQYRNNIEMVKDPAIIEKWKEECRTQVRYRPRETPDAEATLTLSQAENQFIEKYAASYIQTGTKIIMPASAVNLITDEKLLYVLKAAWIREDRFPLSLMLALRPAFRRMRLHLFKAGKDETFVTAIPPKALDAEHAIDSIKDMVQLISAHPGWNRKQLVEKLYPGKSIDDPEVIEKMSSLAWLIDKGHIIEFFNGTYAIPGHLKTPGAVPTEKPQEHHHAEQAVDNAVVDEVNVSTPVAEELNAEPDVERPDQPAAD